MAVPGGTANWFQNDALFFEQLQAGHHYATTVAARLTDAGLAVGVTPMEIRANIADRARFVDEHDLTVGAADPCRIDVKSRDLAFSSSDDYPYPTAIVDTVAGWNQKTHKPRAIVLVSQTTEAMIVVSARDAPHQWTVERRHDRVRKIHDQFYMVTRDRLRTFDELVHWLREREHRASPGGGA